MKDVWRMLHYVTVIKSLGVDLLICVKGYRDDFNDNFKRNLSSTKKTLRVTFVTFNKICDRNTLSTP